MACPVGSFPVAFTSLGPGPLRLKNEAGTAELSNTSEGNRIVSNSSTENPGTNPAWKPLLDALPEALHAAVIPHLKQWDTGVQQKLQEVRDGYKGLDAYKPLAEGNIDPQLIQQSLYLLEQFRTKPEEVVAEAIQAFNLPYKTGTDVEDEDLDEMDYSDDITKHPQWAAVQQRLEQVESGLSAREQAEQLAQATQNHLDWLKSAKEEHGDFDETYVTALMSQGVDGIEAINKYKELLVKSGAIQVPNNQNQHETPPVVMGGDGTTGSGVPTEPINFGAMKKSELNDTVVKILEAEAAQNNQG